MQLNECVNRCAYERVPLVAQFHGGPSINAAVTNYSTWLTSGAPQGEHILRDPVDNNDDASELVEEVSPGARSCGVSSLKADDGPTNTAEREGEVAIG